METIRFTGLDPAAPYGLGNKDFIADLLCDEHGEITQEETGMRSGYNDGYTWAHPFCKKCNIDLKHYRPLIASNETELSGIAAGGRHDNG